MCDELKTHTDGYQGLCKVHAYEVKQAGGDVALELEPEPEPTDKGNWEPPRLCEWPNWPTPETNEQPTED